MKHLLRELESEIEHPVENRFRIVLLWKQWVSYVKKAYPFLEYAKDTSFMCFSNDFILFNIVREKSVYPSNVDRILIPPPLPFEKMYNSKVG